MILRSFLFVPADSEKKLAKAKTSSADALILDLEDAVAADRRTTASGLVNEFLKEKIAPGSGRPRLPGRTARIAAPILKRLSRADPQASSYPSRMDRKRYAFWII